MMPNPLRALEFVSFICEAKESLNQVLSLSACDCLQFSLQCH